MWILIGLVILILGLWLAIRPPRMEPVEKYFSQAADGTLTRDVEDKIKMLEGVLAKDPSDFSDFKNFPRMAVKWTLSFTVYALAPIAFIKPDPRQKMGDLIDRLIQRMHFPICWDVYVTRGLGVWPFEGINVMYTGHLQLMMLCHYLVTGDTKYEPQIQYLTKTIVEAMRKNYFKGVVCQPHNYFTECNTINVYALKLYDILFPADHENEIAEWWEWAKAHMRNPETGLFYEAYRPVTRYMARSQVGFNNGWIALFMPAIEPDKADEFYQLFRRQFMRKFLWYWWATVIPRDRILELDRSSSWWQRLKRRIPDGKSTLFAFYAAREFGDQEAWYGMARLIAKIPFMRVDTRVHYGIMNIKIRGNPAIQTSFLFAKIGELGLKRLLDVAAAEAEHLRRPQSYEDYDPEAMELPLPDDAKKAAEALMLEVPDEGAGASADCH